MDYIDILPGQNHMGWIKVDSTTILESMYPKLVSYIKNKFKVNKAYNNVTGGIQLADPAGLYPRFVGNTNALTNGTNPDYPNVLCSDNIDYAKKSQGTLTTYTDKVSSHAAPKKWSWSRGFVDGNGESKYVYGLTVLVNLDYNTLLSKYETRVKSKFFSLLIYAGYPN